jgi:hypothetical protein
MGGGMVRDRFPTADGEVLIRVHEAGGAAAGVAAATLEGVILQMALDELRVLAIGNDPSALEPCEDLEGRGPPKLQESHAIAGMLENK